MNSRGLLCHRIPVSHDEGGIFTIHVKDPERRGLEEFGPTPLAARFKIWLRNEKPPGRAVQTVTPFVHNGATVTLVITTKEI